jgi:hypothetical protein
MSMNKSSHEKRVQILNLLVEGNSMRATARLADVAFNTVAKLFVETAKVCSEYQDQAFRNLTCKRLQLDEIWSFVYSKERNVPEGKEGQAGDVWTWVAIDADSKLVPSWRIGEYQIHLRQMRQDVAAIAMINNNAVLFIIRLRQAHRILKTQKLSKSAAIQ